MGFLMPPHPLTNFEIQNYHQNAPRSNADVGIHRTALFCNRSEIVFFNSFGIEHVPEEIKKFAGSKNIKANILRVQANNSVMYGCFCIGLIDFMLAGKKLTDVTSLFSPYDFKKNDNIILSCFNDE